MAEHHDDQRVPDALDAPEDHSTGVREVDDVLAGLDTLDGRPVADHLVLFEDMHRRLRQVLDAG